MLNPSVAQAVIDQGLFLGADFVDLFVENQKISEVELLSGKIEKLNSGIDFGVGLRMVVGRRVLYGYTNHTDQEELLRVISLIAAQIDEAGTETSTQFTRQDLADRHPVDLSLTKGSHVDAKVAFLKTMDEAARSEHEYIQQFVGRILQREQHIEIFNSDGLHAADVRHYSRIAATAIAEDGGEQSSGYTAPGALRGWEFSHKHDAQELARTAAKQALVKLHAADCPSGEMPALVVSSFTRPVDTCSRPHQSKRKRRYFTTRWGR